MKNRDIIVKINPHPHNIKLVAIDMDGTFARSDYTYDIPRFKAILSRMKEVGAQLVVASGNQYYQLRSLFPDDHNELSFVAENGALVKDKKELVLQQICLKRLLRRFLI